MPEFAKHIEIRRNGGYTSLRIDGQDLRWYVGEEIEVCHRAGEMATVTLTIPAERVTSDDSLTDPCTCKQVGGCCSDCPTASPPRDSMLDAAKLSLKEAERYEAQAEDDDPDVSPRRRMRDEILLANAQASIAVAEALSRQGTSPETLFRRAGFDSARLRSSADR